MVNQNHFKHIINKTDKNKNNTITSNELNTIESTLPLENPSARIINSLTKILKGVPVIAKMAMIEITAVTGIVLIAPLCFQSPRLIL